MDKEFFIGYLPKMPPGFRKWILYSIILTGIITVLSSVWIIHGQAPLAPSTFELGKLSKLEGVLVKKPVPMLAVRLGEDAQGRPLYQHYLLVAFGKNGAEQTVQEWENQVGKDLNGKSVQLSGTLIYYDGKALLELTEGLQALVAVTDRRMDYSTDTRKWGTQHVTGEIIDPKCYFGVMKPGSDKPHQSCAVRCIAGGIPPVLKVENRAGESQYYLLMGENGEKINDKLLSFVAQPVTVHGNLEAQGDWKVLSINPETGCQRLSY